MAKKPLKVGDRVRVYGTDYSLDPASGTGTISGFAPNGCPYFEDDGEAGKEPLKTRFSGPYNATPAPVCSPGQEAEAPCLDRCA